MARVKQDLTKITTNIHTNILEIVDEFASDNNITRTMAFSVLLTFALQKQGYGDKKN